MNIRTKIYSTVVLLVIIAISSVVWITGFNSSSNETPKQQGKSTTNSSSINGAGTTGTAQHIAPGTTNAPPTDNASAKSILEEILKRRGLKERPPVAQYLHDEIATGDKARMLRAFDDAVYHQYWNKSDVVAALKTFLNDPTPYVRYLAGRDFLIMGDDEGYSALLELVQSNTSLDGLSQDARIDAADTLAQFRQSNATQAVYRLYQQTNNGALIADLQKLAPDKVGTLVPPKVYYSDPLAIRDYGIENDRQFIPQITATFNDTQKPELKVAAAWALATMTNDQNALTYLLQATQSAISGQPPFANNSQIIEYLGTVQTPQSKQTLEAALTSASPQIVQAATVNLIFNQGGSSKANQIVAEALTPKSNPLGVDLALNLAPHLLTDPQVLAAGETFSKQEGGGVWQRATVDRGSWPVYNWIDSYVVKLNKSQ